MILVAWSPSCPIGHAAAQIMHILSSACGVNWVAIIPIIFEVIGNSDKPIGSSSAPRRSCDDPRVIIDYCTYVLSRVIGRNLTFT
jgi:hypothetical protein